MNVTNEHKVIKNKVGLLRLAEQLESVSKACKVMGFSRENYYVGSIKGIGRIYQQTFIDPYSKLTPK